MNVRTWSDIGVNGDIASVGVSLMQQNTSRADRKLCICDRHRSDLAGFGCWFGGGFLHRVHRRSFNGVVKFSETVGDHVGCDMIGEGDRAADGRPLLPVDRSCDVRFHFDFHAATEPSEIFG